MDDGSPLRHKEKRSKKNQDHVAVPRPSSRTNAACPRAGAGGSRVARRRDEQGSSAAAPPPAPASVGDVPIIDAEEEALELAGHTIAAPPVRASTHGSGFITELVPFLGVLPIMREPAMAPNLGGGWTPLLPVDYHHRVRDIRSMRGRHLYDEEEKDLWLEYRFWHPFHFDFYESLIYRKFP